MRSGRESTAAGVESSDEATPSPVLAIRLTYNQAGQIHVTGPVTGERYAFADSGSALEVNPRDAAALLRSGLFRRA